jgi:competence protein ComFC
MDQAMRLLQLLTLYHLPYAFCYTQSVGILDLFFPKYCVNCKKIGDFLCSDCFAFLSFDVSYICLVCNRASVNGLTHPGCSGRYTIDGAFSSISYNGVAKKLIYVFKYKPYVSGLRNFLIDLFYEGVIQNELVIKILESYPLFIPIPLHGSKIKKRGYNQSLLLAKGLGDKVGLEVKDVMLRIKKTKSQYGLKRKKRIENISNAFELKYRKEDLIKGKIVFLIDDVLTSGSTLLEAGNVLKRKGAKKVFGLTLARG